MNSCPLCHVRVTGLDGHHLVPLEYGGKEDGVKISICKSCHGDIHRYAEGPTSLSEVPPRLQRYVEIVRIAKANFEHGLAEARDARRISGIHFDDYERQVIELLKQRWGMNSIESVVKQLVRTAARLL